MLHRTLLGGGLYAHLARMAENASAAKNSTPEVEHGEVYSALRRRKSM